jgi:hypothetical protein
VGALTCGAREKDRAIQAVISGRGKANVVLKSAGCMRKAADVHCTPWQATHKVIAAHWVHECICPYLLLVCRRICRRDCLEGSAQRFALCVRDAELANQIVVLAHVEERAPVNVVICWRVQRMWRWGKREVRKKYATGETEGSGEEMGAHRLYCREDRVRTGHIIDRSVRRHVRSLCGDERVPSDQNRSYQYTTQAAAVVHDRVAD